ncbi:GIN domain-containing protein [Mucilaginibacter gotjawali]|uniref:Uncharacterized protein n=2 Tax=Mucilaginibacter gotjawali TaxID=1550579 RepID=A0A839SMF2_9SPHI|nr:DUF2807 domain-containing protein [Mucilaginibacter gotjawali]MBB3059066.1 hypothetical protein [Mucilaginibacter gotjawali]BAU52130.1 hypothetical protein MgSA37_00280 [Mucilaginibacter gotjawali]
MKTLILTIAIAVSTLFGISQTTYAATGTQQVTQLSGVSNISEIEVHGNVQVYLSEGNTNQVKVYNNYYAENALVQDENGVLRITSYSPEKLVVWVTANQLAKLSAYDNAEVKSFGKFSAIDLDVKLFNNASAKLDMDTFSASISLDDCTTALLTGKIANGNIQYTHASALNTTGLEVSNLVTSVKTHRPFHMHPTEFAAL